MALIALLLVRLQEQPVGALKMLKTSRGKRPPCLPPVHSLGFVTPRRLGMLSSAQSPHPVLRPPVERHPPKSTMQEGVLKWMVDDERLYHAIWLRFQRWQGSCSGESLNVEHRRGQLDHESLHALPKQWRDFTRTPEFYTFVDRASRLAWPSAVGHPPSSGGDPESAVTGLTSVPAFICRCPACWVARRRRMFAVACSASLHS